MRAKNMLFNVYGKLLEEKLIFNHLNLGNIQTANLYFKNNLDNNKLSRKKSSLSYSFINTSKGIFVISRETIGIGASGRVKIAKCVVSGRMVAVKIQHWFISSLKHYEELVNEGLVLHKINQLYGSAIRWNKFLKYSSEYYPNIQNNQKNESSNLKYYIFIELLEGITLRDYFTNHRINKELIATEKFIAIIIKILHKIQILHKHNIVHGDLSFNNILISEGSDGTFDVNLIDFGMASILDNDIAKCRTIGSKHNIKKSYLPPEYDVRVVTKEIIPQLWEKEDCVTEKQLQSIIDFAKLEHGFVHKSTDLYILCWNINYFMVLPKGSILRKTIKHNLHKNPFLRCNLDLFLEQLTTIISPEKPQKNPDTETKKYPAEGFFDDLLNTNTGSNADTVDSLFSKHNTCMYQLNLQKQKDVKGIKDINLEKDIDVENENIKYSLEMDSSHRLPRYNLF
jgi:serine/threonine protein kinase